MEKPSWLPTLAAQVSLFLALFIALQLGQPQKLLHHDRSKNAPLDLYFISVRGGFRNFNQQSQLLKQVGFSAIFLVYLSFFKYFIFFLSYANFIYLFIFWLVGLIIWLVSLIWFYLYGILVDSIIFLYNLRLFVNVKY